MKRTLGKLYANANPLKRLHDFKNVETLTGIMQLFILPQRQDMAIGGVCLH